ncbi:hypothetical protein [Lagierella sp.]|uniref:hypothetical protein n=1 Tax=Lagierella sp. TaxID=2849657 RepID=UPI002611DD57|nr:hypothetical protein [Lagierella sp.]
MSKNGKLVLGVVVVLLIGVGVYWFSQSNDYASNFEGQTYSYTFKENKEEYKNGYRYNILFFQKDKITVDAVEKIGELPENVDIDQKGDRQVNKEFKNPVYNKEKNIITADGLEEVINVIDIDNLEYNGNVYTKEVKK